VKKNEAALNAIRDNSEFDAIKRAHKAGMAISKMYLEALKPLGFKTGVDCKHAFRTFADQKHLPDYLSDAERDEMTGLEKALSEACAAAELKDAPAA
jgi:hypothetical protein